MTKSEAIHRAALRKHRHKGNYIATHEALLAEAEYLQRCGCGYDFLEPIYCKAHMPKRRSLWQIIKGWFA